jgi:small-conductance mechanosensitive channel
VVSFETGRRRTGLIWLLVTAALALVFAVVFTFQCQDSFTNRCDYTGENDVWLALGGTAPLVAMVFVAAGRRMTGYAALALAPLTYVIFTIGYLSQSATT